MEMVSQLRRVIKIVFLKLISHSVSAVPTNYRIKTTRNGGKMNDEDKNLGRWVNRQRSLYQDGKLRSDRQRVSRLFVLPEFLHCNAVIILISDLT